MEAGSLGVQPFPEEEGGSDDGPTSILCGCCKSDHAVRRAKQNSLIGNGFHIPTVMALLCMIPGFLEAKLVAPPIDWAEAGLQARCQGTVWEHKRLATFPGLLQADQIVHEMQTHFTGISLADTVWTSIAAGCRSCDLTALQQYTAWQRMRGQPWEVLGPQPLLGRDRAAIMASFGHQRFAGDTNKGLDHLLSPGLEPEEHMRQGQSLTISVSVSSVAKKMMFCLF